MSARGDSGKAARTPPLLQAFLAHELNGCSFFQYANSYEGAQIFVQEASALVEALRLGCLAEDGFATANQDIQQAAFGGINTLLALANFAIENEMASKRG